MVLEEEVKLERGWFKWQELELSQVMDFSQQSPSKVCGAPEKAWHCQMKATLSARNSELNGYTSERQTDKYGFIGGAQQYSEQS